MTIKANTNQLAFLPMKSTVASEAANTDLSNLIPLVPILNLYTFPVLRTTLQCYFQLDTPMMRILVFLSATQPTQFFSNAASVVTLTIRQLFGLSAKRLEHQPFGQRVSCQTNRQVTILRNYWASLSSTPRRFHTRTQLPLSSQNPSGCRRGIVCLPTESRTLLTMFLDVFQYSSHVRRPFFV